MANLEYAYAHILLSFGLDYFSSKEFKKVVSVDNPNLMLHRLCKEGFLTRYRRGVYRATHPLILSLERGGSRWRDKVAQKDYLPILEFVVVKLVEFFWNRITSLLIFGSVARGQARAESDIDILLVAEGLPKRYSERIGLVRRALSGVEDVRLKMWERARVYPLIDVIALEPEEASTNHPFYLDMLGEAIVVLDRNGFMKSRLEALEKKLCEIGARKVVLPDGRWFWDLKSEIRKGEVIEL
jgi:predicted nucleotidyltransferase